MSWIGRSVMIALCMNCLQIMTLGDDNESKTVITSRTLEYDYQSGIAVFTGNVMLFDDDIRLVADDLRVLLGASNEVQSLAAVGNVTVQSEDRTGSCGKAIYLVTDGELIMIGNAKVVSSRELITGSRILFRQADDKVVCHNARIVFFPDVKDLETNNGYQ
ncbi:MAG: hypothetical protein JXN60_00405 [Lentisphaerae bacterium]|nr:hypothetical protein [Lentisphaerota bacterium]